MSAADWKIEVRNQQLTRVGELDDFESLELSMKFNDVSTWRLTMHRQARMAPALCEPGAGIIVTRHGGPVMSGFVVDQEHDVSESRNVLVLSGVDDTAFLADRRAHPQPSTAAPPYSVQEADTRTGQASTLIRDFVNDNAGPPALTAREVPELAVGADPFVGPTLTVSARWQSLLELVQEIAAASEAAGTRIGFFARQTNQDLISFFIFGSEDRSDTVRFSLESGNLASFKYKRSRPQATYAIVGGEGEGTARTIFERPNSSALAEWGRIESALVDSRNGGTTAELAQAADEELLTNGPTSSLSITPIDTEGLQFWRDYLPGHKVTVVLDTLGPREEIVTGRAVAQGDAVADNYLVALAADALPFPTGTRVVVRQADGTLKEPGVRSVTGRTTEFGFTNIDFTPPLSGPGTVTGDYLEALSMPVYTGAVIQDVIREATVQITPDGEDITPVIGSPGAKPNPYPRIFDVVRRLRRGVRNLERR